MKRKFFILILLIVGIVLPIFLQLGGRGLNEPDEGRYSEMGREMALTGDWLVPRLNGVPHYAKPPWIYWCIALSFKCFGLNEWAARLPSALAAVVTALTVFAFGYHMSGKRAGLIAAFILVSSILFFILARLITPDMMLTACITIAFYCFWRWWSSEPHSWKWLLGFYFSLSIGFLDKGLVPLGVCFFTVIGFLLIQKQWKNIPKLCLGRGLLLIALIGLPWFLILCYRNPDLYNFYLLGEVKDRILSGRGRSQPWFYHFQWLPGDCWPWTVLGACAIWVHFKWWRSKDPLGLASCLLLSWFIFSMILFSASSSKLPTYILPVFPSIALMLGLWLARCFENGSSSAPSWAQFLTYILFPVPLVGLWLLTRPVFPEMISVWIRLIAIGIFAGAIVWFLIFFFSKRHIRNNLFIWWGASLVTLQLIAFFMEKIETDLRHNSSWRSLTRALEPFDVIGMPLCTDLHPNGKKPVFKRAGPRVIMYEFYFRSGSFYLMKDKAEMVPLYGGNSLWEIGRDIDAEIKLNRADLVELLKGPETVFGFTRPNSLTELRELTGMELPVIKTASSRNYEVVLFSNRKNGT